MSFTIKDLRDMSDDALIQAHDAVATNTQVGVTYYLDELRRREQQRAVAAGNRLARIVVWLTVAIIVLTLAVVILSVLTLLKA